MARRTGVAIAMAALLAGAAACGGDGVGGGSGKKDRGAKGIGEGAQKLSPIAALKTVDEKTAGANSSKFTSTMTMGSALATKNDGALDWSDGTTGTATVTYTGGSMAQATKAIDADGVLPARYLPDAYYAQVEGAFQSRFPDKSWIRYGYDDLSKFMGPSGDYMKDQMQNSTPGQAVKLLLASKDVKRVGTETVRGVKTTHYAGTVDVADMTRKSSKELTEEQLRAVERQLKSAGITTQKVDIWVDGKDLMIKRLESGETKQGPYRMEAYYSDYGTKVSAEEPPAAETVDFTELQGQG
ncbi:hypothetical protein G5C51_07950 [Streptomyces sp. A7024]|uniref:Lipoprotein n=1 Tax=Streptomyces coryli TaxID=1128680 RepID=A0A6G4TXW4_9ACTN|nr:hypothetical protein [Streptomyces coryli]NGN63841.1 hypothetical protein [Streptomyces coryli]